MDALSVHDLYERWAPNYPAAPHNPLMEAEQVAMLALLPPVAGACVLDLACGSGRYARLLSERGAAQVIALDFSTAMLRQVTRGAPVRADLVALPLRDASCDAVVSGLALGHACDLQACFREITRVLKPRGTLLYSDFHPAAQARGQARSFRDAVGAKFSLPSGRYDRDAHLDALRGAGLVVDVFAEPRAGIEFRAAFAGAEQFHRDWYGVPVLLIARASKP